MRKDRSGRGRLEEHNKDEISSLWWLRRPNQHSLKAESGAFVRAVPIFVQLHWFRLVQIGSEWLWRELLVFTTDDQGGKWQAEVQLGQEGRQGYSDTMQFLPSIFHSILHGSKGE